MLKKHITFYTHTNAGEIIVLHYHDVWVLRNKTRYQSARTAWRTYCSNSATTNVIFVCYRCSEGHLSHRNSGIAWLGSYIQNRNTYIWHLESFELCWRRWEISWIDHVRNDEVYITQSQGKEEYPTYNKK
jgi:hypothetical protein